MTKAYKMMFLTLIFTGTLVSISASSWLGMWLGLEINLLSIIPLMQNTKSMLSAEAAIKYFIVQAMASTIIMATAIILMNKTILTSQLNLQSTLTLMMNSALLTKMGTAPFHFWFPEVMEGLDWLNCLLILTWQKLAPMVLIMYNLKLKTLMIMVIISSMVVSGFLGVNQVSLRKILAYSSINHMGWMLGAMMVLETVWTYYFLIYSLITLNLVILFNKTKSFFLNNLFLTMNENPLLKIWFIINFLSLSGVPPFLGFLPKWMTIQVLVEQGLIALSAIMILTTLFTIFMYVRISMSSILMNASQPKWPTSQSQMSSFPMSMINFISISSLIMVTMMFNIT